MTASIMAVASLTFGEERLATVLQILRSRFQRILFVFCRTRNREISGAASQDCFERQRVIRRSPESLGERIESQQSLPEQRPRSIRGQTLSKFSLHTPLCDLPRAIYNVPNRACKKDKIAFLHPQLFTLVQTRAIVIQENPNAAVIQKL